MPIIVGFKAIPLIAIAPLLTFWLGTNIWAKAVMAATICFFPIMSGCLRGLKAVSEDERLFMRNLGITRVQEVFGVRLYKAVPYLFVGLRVASVLIAVGAIVAEFTGPTSGIGYVILTSSLRLDLPQLFVGIILASFCGVLLYGLTSLAERATNRYLRIRSIEQEAF